jgi:site-specific recombinase XerD
MREARADLRGMLRKAGIEKKISPHKLRHYSACRIMPNGKFALPQNPP